MERLLAIEAKWRILSDDRGMVVGAISEAADTIVRLREALKPFVPQTNPAFIPDDKGVVLSVYVDGAEWLFPAFTWGDLRRARQALDPRP